MGELSHQATHSNAIMYQAIMCDHPSCECTRAPQSDEGAAWKSYMLTSMA